MQELFTKNYKTLLRDIKEKVIKHTIEYTIFRDWKTLSYTESILPKFINRFKTIPIEIQAKLCCWQKLTSLFQNLHGNGYVMHSKNNLEEKEQGWMSCFIRYKDSLQIYHNKLLKDRHTDQQKRIQKQTQIYAVTWFMVKVSLKYGERVIMIMIIHGTRFITCPTGKNKLDSYHTLYTKINSGQTIDKCEE